MADIRLVTREHRPEDTVVEVGPVLIGGKNPLIVIAGPCSVESEEMIEDIAIAVREAGADVLRGGAYKPRTSPYSFRGLGQEGLEYLMHAGKATGMPVISEVMDPRLVTEVAEMVDIIQIGSRDMQAYPLLEEVGALKMPVMLKRGFGNTLYELLGSAEYLMNKGNEDVILCLRGVRAKIEDEGFTSDYKDIKELRKLTHLPIIFDPSHATRNRYKAIEAAKASMVYNPDGIMIEVHNKPKEALSDSNQQISPVDFKVVMNYIRNR